MALTDEQLNIVKTSLGKYVEVQDTVPSSQSTPPIWTRGFISKIDEYPGNVLEFQYVTAGNCMVAIYFNTEQVLGEFDESRTTLTVSNVETLSVKSFLIYLAQ